MTTIAYRDGVLAADSRAYSGDKTPLGWKKKIYRLKDGSLFGASSNKVGVCDNFRRLVEEHGVEKAFDETVPVQAIVIKPCGQIFYFNDQVAFSGPIEAEHLAIGSGQDFAIGAMHIGASASDAVRIAIDCDVWSGGEVHLLELEA